MALTPASLVLDLPWLPATSIASPARARHCPTKQLSCNCTCSLADASAKHTSVASTKLVFSGPKTTYQQVPQMPRSTVAPWAATNMALDAAVVPCPGTKGAGNSGEPMVAKPLDAAWAQQRLEQTSSSLRAALQVAEKITAEEADR